MPFTGNTYTGPAGSTNATAGQVVQSAIWNAIHGDLATALTTLMTQANTNAPGFQNVMAPNGSFLIWQRGLSIAVPASTIAYTADRWYLATGATEASIVAAVADLSAGATPNCAAKVTRNSGQTGTAVVSFGYPFDTDEIYRMRGSLLSFSCAVKSGANWSPASGTLTVTVAFGTGSVGKRVNGFTAETVVLTIPTNLAVSSPRTVISGTSTVIVPVNSGQGEVQFTWTPSGTAGADDSISIDECCLVTGSLIQSFTDIPFQTSLDMCKRHYQKTFPYATAPAQNAGTQGALSLISATSKVGLFWKFADEMRAAPWAITTYSPGGATANWYDLTGGVSLVTVVDVTNSGSTMGIMLYSAATAAAADHLIYLHADANASI